ncbi:MAG TPA: hypothetical protein VHY34_13110, partial [Caulobacteraceae bacterium]|nr:hypothetical protein [Caulobacteraceae bacterium]
FDPALDPWLLTLQGLTLVAAISVLAPLWNLGLVWLDPRRGWWAKASSLMIAGSGLFMAWFEVSERLAGFNVHY